MRKTVTINSKEFLVPTFIGVGAQKCATTWLSECLRRHPEIFMSSPKELHFFGGKHWESKGVEWYVEYFKNSDQYKAAGEFSTSYLVKPLVPERIKSVCGQVKIVLSIRNPTHRFISHYKMCMRDESLPKEDFYLLNVENFHKATKLVPALLINGSYYHGIKNYIDTFGPENVHIMIKEKVDKNPEEEISRLYKFLEVDPHYTPSIITKKINETMIPKSAIFNYVRLKSAKIAKRKFPWIINYLRKFRLDETLRRLNSERGQFRLTVEDAVLNELNLYYQPEVTDIQNLLGQKLDEWNFRLDQVQSN